MLATMGVGPGVPSLLALAKQYIGHKYQKPGNVYLGVVSRLDAPVSGITLFARTSKAAARLSKQFRERQVIKIYWALVAGQVWPRAARLTHHLRKHERHRHVLTCSRDVPGAREASLRYRSLQTTSTGSLLEIVLETGRKHQIRVQLAQHGYPILGDRKYGSQNTFPHGIALHARGLSFSHPTCNQKITLDAPPPKTWCNVLGLDYIASPGSR